MTPNHRKKELLPAIVMLTVGMIVAGCSSGVRVSGRDVPVPKERGIYLLTSDDKLQPLSGNRDWEVANWGQRSDLGSYLEFVIKHPAIARNPGSPEVVSLRKVAWVRSEISGPGTIAPITGNSWAEPDLPAFIVPLEVHRLVGHADTAYVRPQVPLAQGLYSLRIQDGPVATASRIGVQWSSADRARYSSENCVDRYVGYANSYRPCGEQSRTFQQIGAAQLQLHLVPPERQIVNGEPILIVRGVVINTGDRPQRVPMLRARVTDSRGSTLKRWNFEAESEEIAPRQSVPFRTELRDPPSGTAKVNVNFASDVESRESRAGSNDAL